MSSLDPLFDWTVAATLRASVLVLVILVAQRLLRSRLSAKWKYALWLPVLAALLMPALPFLPHWVRLNVEPTQEPATMESPATMADSSRVDVESNELARVPESMPSSSVSPDRVVENETSAEPAILTRTELQDFSSNADAVAPTAPAETEFSSGNLIHRRSPDLRAIVIGVWAVGVSCLSAAVLISYWLTLRRIQRCEIHLGEAKLALVEALAKETGLRRHPRVWLSPVVKTPAVCGSWRPVLLLNADFFEALTDEEADFVLRHELMHIRRGDVVLNTILCSLLALHWFNPLLWFAFFRVRADREAACDDDVLRKEEPGRRVAYGKTLLKLETSFSKPGLCLGLVGMLQGNNRLRDRIDFITHPKYESFSMKSTLSIFIVLAAVLGIAKAMEPQQSPAKPPVVDAASADNREAWQTDLSDLSDYLQSVVRKGTTPDQQYFVDRILRGADSRAIPTVHPYAEDGKSEYFSGYADLTPKNGTIQWTVNEALKGRSVEWEFEIDKSRVINVGKQESGREVKKRFLEVVPRYDAGDQPPITRISTIRVEIPNGEPTPVELIAGDRVRVEGTVGDYATNQGVDPTDFIGPIVVYKRKKDEDALQTTISIGLRNAKITSKQALPSFRFRKVASLPVKNKDYFAHARVAVSFDQKAVISRNYLISRGEDVRDRIGAYLWSLNPDDPKQTRLPDSTTFGFVPNSSLAYMVSWGDGVRFWDTRTHIRSGDFIPHALREDTTIGPAISPSGKVMVTRSQMNHLQFWDISTREPITPEIEQTGTVFGMKFSPDGKWFFSKTGSNLTIWQPETGKLVAGPFRHGIYSYVYSPTTNRIVTFENNDKNEDEWTCRLIVRSGQAFTEVERLKIVGRARKAGWIDDKHLLVIADYKKPGEIAPFTYRKRLVYLVSLTTDEPEIRKLMHDDYIRGSHIAPDRQHFIIRTRDETSCWKVGDREPLWTKPGDHLVYFGDKNWVLLQNGPLTACSLIDGRELWRKNDVGICRVFGSDIWTCNEKEMDVWRVEPDTGPDKARPGSAPTEPKADSRSEPDAASFQLREDKDEQVRAATYRSEAAMRRLIERGEAQEEDFLPLSRLHQLPHLQNLSFPYGSRLTTNDLESLTKLTGIVEIEMGFAGIDSEYVTIEDNMLPLGQLKTLEVLRFCKDGIRDDDLRFVAKLPRLHTLEFNADNGHEDAPICTDKCAEYLCQAGQLRHVVIFDGQFTDQFVAALVRGLPKLETLQLNSPQFTDNSLRLIAKHCENLRKLSIASDQFTTEGLKSLDTLSNLEVVSVRSRVLRMR